MPIDCCLPTIQFYKSFSSAGGERTWETFYLDGPAVTGGVRIVARGGPDIDGYPALKVGDFEVIAEPTSTSDRVVVSLFQRHFDLSKEGRGPAEQVRTTTRLIAKDGSRSSSRGKQRPLAHKA